MMQATVGGGCAPQAIALSGYGICRDALIRFIVGVEVVRYNIVLYLEVASARE